MFHRQALVVDWYFARISSTTMSNVVCFKDLKTFWSTRTILGMPSGWSRARAAVSRRRFFQHSPPLSRHAATWKFQQRVFFFPSVPWPGVGRDDATQDDRQSFRRRCRHWRGGIILRSRAAPSWSKPWVFYRHQPHWAPDQQYPYSQRFRAGSNFAQNSLAPSTALKAD